MKTSQIGEKSGENLVFDYNTIRLLIGLIAFSFPWVVSILASEITPSISWSYHTDARDFFVGLLFVLGAFLMSYKGHKPELKAEDIGRFWHWLAKFWPGAINFRKWERKHEEDLVSWVGGIAAWITAVYPTTKCIGENCPADPKSTIHYIGAIILFSSTVYFCLVAFIRRAKKKLKSEDNQEIIEKPKIHPLKLRIRLYGFCGWGIAAIMIGAVILKRIQFDAVGNITFWAETAALVLFGIAWMVASRCLPVFTYRNERQKPFSSS